MQLQQPAFVFMNGSLRPWSDAVLHIGCEAVTRSVNVFEGLKGYWQPDGAFAVLQLEEHYNRLRRSARIMRLPWSCSFGEYQRAIMALAAALLDPERDMWFRTTLYAIEGHWGEGTVVDLVVTAYHQERRAPAAIQLGVSTWRRSPDTSQPPRVKAGSNYHVARLARMEARDRGWDDMVLLNEAGRVAEATGSCVLMVRNGRVITPPPTEGALESITVDLIEQLALSAGLTFERRPVDRTELLIADELALAGTLAELTPVHCIEGLPVSGASSVLSALQRRYRDAACGVRPHPAVRLTVVHRTSHAAPASPSAPTAPSPAGGGENTAHTSRSVERHNGTSPPSTGRAPSVPRSPGHESIELHAC